MSVLPNSIMRKKFRRDVSYWLTIWTIPVFMTVFHVVLFVVQPTSQEVLSIYLTLLGLVWLCCVACAVLMIPVVFLEWFPPEYYEDLIMCPYCGEQDMKVINDGKCFNCGKMLLLPEASVQTTTDDPKPQS